MPIYEYACRACAHQFEQLVLASDIPACPDCQSQDLEKLISMIAVSSEHTRAQNLKGARKKAMSVKHEEQHEHHKRLHGHDD